MSTHVPSCRHIKTNGIQCKSPALTGETWCYFHRRIHQRHSSYRFTPAARSYVTALKGIELSALEDRESIQIALSEVINALATGALESRRAAILLYGLQLASSNARNLKIEPSAHEVVRSSASSSDGLDLAEPGTTVDINPATDSTPDGGSDRSAVILPV